MTVPPAATDIPHPARKASAGIQLTGNDHSIFLLLAGLMVIGGAIGSIVGVQLLTLLHA